MNGTDLDVIIIGGGIVGLAVADTLSAAGWTVAVMERHPTWGQETSSRNSEVIHGGLYYPTGSLKARLCIEGRRLLYDLCSRTGVPHRRCGKIIVALNADQMADIETLHILGTANGVEGLRLLTGSEIQRMEPGVRAYGGLYSEETGILNAHSLMDCYAERIIAADGVLSPGTEVTGLELQPGGWTLAYRDSTGPNRIPCRAVINCAGLHAQSIMRMAGMNPEAMGLKGYLCKGDYFSVRGSRRLGLTHLVYPVPVRNLHGLGIHTVLNLDGSFKLGPNAYYTDQINYAVDESAQTDFFKKVSTYLPGLKKEDLTPDMSGMRPKLSAPGEPARDFHIAHETDSGLPGFFNLAGIESPGLTSSPAIGRHVARMVTDFLA